MRSRLPLAIVVLSVLCCVRPTSARAQEQPPALSVFLDAVRGYDVTTIRRSFPAYNRGLFETLFGAGEPIPLATPELRDLFAQQRVITPAGRVIDLGHVVTGLEAGTALPPMALLAQRATGCSMVAAVTWSGDVGQALHDYAAAPDSDDPAPYFDREAPPDDLLGDIDGWVLGTEAAGSPVDVAGLLERSYLTGDLESTRFRRFATLLGGADGAALSDDARARIAAEITCFARAIATFTRSGVAPAAIDAASPYFVNRFLATIEEGLATEVTGNGQREAQTAPDPVARCL